MSERSGGALTRLVRAWRALTPERRLATYAAAALFLTMLLPWYQQNTFVRDRGIVSHDVSAFGVFSFVEAAVLLVALAVLALLFARAEGREFHLPGGDGAAVLGAGLWAALLLVWRLFDKPGVDAGGVNVGVQWGIFFALGAAGLLAYAGSRMRHADQRVHRREPPVVDPEPPPRWRDERPAPGTTQTRVLPPERPRPERRAARQPPAMEGQLTIPLSPEPPEGEEQR